MRWQNPWAWLGLLTLVLPVLVHLFSRRQTRVEPFPTLRFIDVSRLLPTRRTQLTDVLLLLVRLLVLLIAVAALAQPLFRNRASSDSVAIAVIVDTTAVGSDSTNRPRIDRALSDVVDARATQLRIDTHDPTGALAGAASWLETHSGTRQLVVVSDFRDGTIDSLDLAQLPRDISVRLVAAGAGAGTSVSTTSGAVWLAPSSNVAPNLRAAIISAVRTLGGSAVTDSIPPGSQRLIMVAPVDADSMGAWHQRARPLSRGWMGDVMVRLSADTILTTASANAPVEGDTSIAPNFTVIARTSSGAPVAAVAELAGTPSEVDSPRLLVFMRTSYDALTTAAVLLSASRALEPGPRWTSGGTAPDSAQLSRWEKAPAAAVTVNYPRSTDALTGMSDARWFWVVVLLLLGAETVMRSRARVGNSAFDAPDTTSSGSVGG